MNSYSAEQLAQSLLELENDTDIKDFCGQSYDNANSMSSKYSDLQTLIKELNYFVDYIPCITH